MNLWVAPDAKLATAALTGAVSSSVSLKDQNPLVGQQAFDELSLDTKLGSYTMPSDATFTSAALVTLYLKVTDTTVINNVYVRIIFSGVKADTYRGTVADTNTTHTTPESNEMVLQANEVMKVEVSVPIHTLKTTSASPSGLLKANQGIELRAAVSALSQGAKPSEILVLFGSANHPSRISAPVAALPTGVEATSQLRSYFLADNHAYGTGVPTATTAKLRAVESVGMVNGAPVTGAASAVAPASGWSWGRQSLPTGLKANGDAVISFWLATELSNQPVVLTGLKAVVVFDPPTGPNIIRQQDIGLRRDVFVTNGIVGYSLGLNMSGIDLPAGSAFELFFYTSTTSDSAAFKLNLVYGSAALPSAIRFVVASGDPGGPASDDEDPVTDDEEVVDPPEDEVVDPVVPATPSTAAAAGGNATVKGDAAFAKVKDIEAPANVPGIGAVALVAAVVVAVLLLRRRA